MKLVSILVMGAVASRIGVAAIQVSHVTDATGLAEGLPEYGNPAIVFCTGLTGVSGTIQAKTFPLPYELAGVSVRVAGVPAPILVVVGTPDEGGQQRITFQMPLQRQDRIPRQLTVSQFGDSNQIILSSSPFWVFFFQTASPPARPGEVVAFHADGLPADSGNPARPGEIITIYGTNLTTILGTTPAPPLGSASPASPLAWLKGTVCSGGVACVLHEFWINGKAARTSYFGLAPGQIGIFQVNVLIPQDATSGYLTLMAVRGFCSSHPPGSDCVYSPSVTGRLAVRSSAIP